MHVSVKLVIGIFFLLSLGGMGFYFANQFYHSSFFTLKNVESNFKLEDTLIQDLKGESLFKLKADKVYQSIINKHPEYKSVIVSKKFPSTLSVKIEKRTPFAQLLHQNYFSIDRQGVIIDKNENAAFNDLPPIEFSYYPQRLGIGMRIVDQRLTQAFNLIDTLTGRTFLRRFPIQLINTGSDKSTYFVAGGAEIIIGEDDFMRKFDLLERVIKGELKGDLNIVKYIDLRYKKVYIGYKR